MLFVCEQIQTQTYSFIYKKKQCKPTTQLPKAHGEEIQATNNVNWSFEARRNSLGANLKNKNKPIKQ